MAITYTLYCKDCYDRLKASQQGLHLKARSYNSYFVCSRCSFETDRGYAIQNTTTLEARRSTADKQLSISAG